MKPLLSYVLSRNCPKQFVSFRLPAKSVNEKAILKIATTEIDISNRHCIVCQVPMQIAVFISSEQLLSLDFGGAIEMVVTHNDIRLSTVKLIFISERTEGNTSIVFFKAANANLFYANPLVWCILLWRFKNQYKQTFREKKIQAGLFSYPRCVIVVSFREGGDYNMFPMDFQCYFEEGNLHVFGLRNTNITLARILATKKLVVSDTSNASIETLYSLGGHHSKMPPDIASLPFGVTDSEVFKFPVPAFASSYSEIEVIGSQQLGSHTVFIGKCINKRILVNQEMSQLFHIHFFQFLNSVYKEET